MNIVADIISHATSAKPPGVRLHPKYVVSIVAIISPARHINGPINLLFMLIIIKV